VPLGRLLRRSLRASTPPAPACLDAAGQAPAEPQGSQGQGACGARGWTRSWGDVGLVGRAPAGNGASSASLERKSFRVRFSTKSLLSLYN